VLLAVELQCSILPNNGCQLLIFDQMVRASFIRLLALGTGSSKAGFICCRSRLPANSREQRAAELPRDNDRSVGGT